MVAEEGEEEVEEDLWGDPVMDGDEEGGVVVLFRMRGRPGERLAVVMNHITSMTP